MKAYSIAGVAVAMVALQAVSSCDDKLARVSSITKGLCGIVPIAADVANVVGAGDYRDEAAIAKVLCDAFNSAIGPKSARYGSRRVAVGQTVTLNVRGRAVQVRYVGRG